ncbi:hypothetical protein BDD12DRAFT_842034 [Trichophaea hybrida]|nr:hypothetical protein BDD12DRAFT_842034 [Trichophaea hybrida]
MTTIRIGETEHTVDLNLVPYLASWHRFELVASKSEPLRHEIISELEDFGTTYDGITKGIRNFFRLLRCDIDKYTQLFDKLDFLGVEILDGWPLERIVTEIKSGKSGGWCDRFDVPPSRKNARNCAFRLIYLMHTATFEDPLMDSNAIFNTVLYVVSHAGVFLGIDRFVVKSIYLQRFDPSPKQLTAGTFFFSDDYYDSHSSLDLSYNFRVSGILWSASVCLMQGLWRPWAK